MILRAPRPSKRTLEVMALVILRAPRPSKRTLEVMALVILRAPRPSKRTLEVVALVILRAPRPSKRTLEVVALMVTGNRQARGATDTTLSAANLYFRTLCALLRSCSYTAYLAPLVLFPHRSVSARINKLTDTVCNR